MNSFDLVNLIGKDDPTVDRIAGLCHFDVVELAVYCSESLRTLERGFHKIGTTPHRWMTSLKLKGEVLKLMEADTSGGFETIKKFALDAGYRDPTDFDRAFKNQFGMSPRSFLQERREALKTMGIRLDDLRSSGQSLPLCDERASHFKDCRKA